MRDSFYHCIDNIQVNSLDSLIYNKPSTYTLIRYSDYNDENYRLKSERISHYSDCILSFHGVYYAFYKDKILWDCNNACIVSTQHDAKPNMSNAEYLDHPIYLMDYSWGTCNYTHFLTELLPRFSHFLLLKERIKDLKLLFKFDHHLNNIDCIVDIFDISRDDVIIYNIKDVKTYISNDLYISNTFEPSIKVDDLNSFFTDTHLNVYKDVANRTLKKISREEFIIDSNLRDLDKIYYSRGLCLNRKLLNEDDWYSELHKRGYIRIYPEKYNLIENIFLVNNASRIIGEHGSAFSNLFFCFNRNLVATCLGHPYEHINLLWSVISNRNKFRFVEYNNLGICNGSEKISPWYLNIEEAVKIL